MDASGAGRPSPVAAGFGPESVPSPGADAIPPAVWAGALLVAVALVAAHRRRRAGRPAV